MPSGWGCKPRWPCWRQMPCARCTCYPAQSLTAAGSLPRPSRHTQGEAQRMAAKNATASRLQTPPRSEEGCLKVATCNKQCETVWMVHPPLLAVRGLPCTLSEWWACRILRGLWVALLQDWLILSTQPAHVQAAYQPRLFAAPTPSVLAAVKPFLQKSWPLVLAATCAVLSSTIEVGQN